MSKHEPEAEEPTPDLESFPYHRLDVYGAAVELARMSYEVVQRIPRGYARFGEQLKNSAGAVPLLIAEGSSRRVAPQQRQRFVEARGEAGEAAATLEVLEALRLVDEKTAREARILANRIAAMLTGLIRIKPGPG